MAKHQSQGQKSRQVRRQRFNQFISHPGICDMRRPIKPDKVQSMIEKAQSALERLQVAREKYAADPEGNTPEIPQSVYIDLNVGMYTENSWNEQVKSYNLWVTGEGPKPEDMLPTTYQPFRVELVNLLNCRCAMRGQAIKHNRKPKDWDESSLGEWQPGDYIDNPTRRCHPKNVIELVDEYDVKTKTCPHVVEINGVKYIVGNGSREGSYPQIIHNSDVRGLKSNYGANETVLGELTFDGMKNLPNIVGKVSDRWGDGWRFPDGVSITFLLPEQFATPGYLWRGDKMLTPAQIRAAINDGETKGIKFRSIEQKDAAYRGKSISATELWAAVRKTMDKDALSRFESGKRGGEKLDKDAFTRSTDNVGVQCRVAAEGLVPLGFRAACIGVVTGKDVPVGADEIHFFKAIGERTNIHLSKTMRDARRRDKIAEEIEEIEEVVRPEKKSVEKGKHEKSQKQKSQKSRKPRAKKEVAELSAPEVEVKESEVVDADMVGSNA